MPTLFIHYFTHNTKNTRKTSRIGQKATSYWAYQLKSVINTNKMIGCDTDYYCFLMLL